MKKNLSLLVLLAALTGCSSVYVPKIVFPEQGGTRADSGYQLKASHWSDVSKIRDEATRLGIQVQQGKLTKTQAAQALNRFRINLVGRNAVDDSMYEVYLRSAVDSQRGAISGEQSKMFIQNALRGWQQRWPNMSSKPNNPAFTNFLMEVMNMQPLK